MLIFRELKAGDVERDFFFLLLFTLWLQSQLPGTKTSVPSRAVQHGRVLPCVRVAAHHGKCSLGLDGHPSGCCWEESWLLGKLDYNTPGPSFTGPGTV